MSTVEAHKAFHDALESSKSWNEALADNKVFVVAVYLMAIIPWALLTRSDSIDRRWRPIRKLYIPTILQLILIVISFMLLLAYVTVQYLAGDVKEAMAGVAVFLAAFIPLIRVGRQLWIILATGSFAKIIQTVPNLTGDCQPGTENGQLSERIYNDPTPELFNSSHFFDNDRPGDGVLRLGRSWWFHSVGLILLGTWRRLWLKLFTRPFSTEFADGKLDSLFRAPGYVLAFVISKFWLRAVDSFSIPDPAEDLLTKMAWIYGNVFVDPHNHPSSPSRKIIHLGLLVQVGYSLWVEAQQKIAVLERDTATGNTDAERSALDLKVQEYQNLFGKYSWFVPFLGKNTLPSVAEGNIHVPISSRTSEIWTCDYTIGIVPTIGASANFSPHDYEEAHLKLPVTSGTAAEHIFYGYRWEHTAEIITSTLELHSLKTSLLGNETIFDTGDQLSDTVWTYVFVAVVYGTYGKERRKFMMPDDGSESAAPREIRLPSFFSFSPSLGTWAKRAFSGLLSRFGVVAVFFLVVGVCLFFFFLFYTSWFSFMVLGSLSAIMYKAEIYRILMVDLSRDNSADLKDIRESLLRLAGTSETGIGQQSTENRTGGEWWDTISSKCLAVADLICHGAKPIRKARIPVAKRNIVSFGWPTLSASERESFLRSVSPACTGASETSSERSRREMHRDAAPEDPGSADPRSKLQKMIDKAEKASRGILEDADLFVCQRLHEHNRCICTNTDVETGIRCVWRDGRSAADAEAQSSNAPSAHNNASEVSDEERQ